MMPWPIDALPYPFELGFMQRALVASVVVGIFAPMIGTFVVQKKMSLIGDGIGHLAFAGEPDLLVLDEPIAGVDAESQRRFRDSITHLIEDHGAGVLLVSHELSAVAPDLDRVVVLKRRVVFDGPPAQLAASGVSLGVHPEDLPLWLEELR